MIKRKLLAWYVLFLLILQLFFLTMPVQHVAAQPIISNENPVNESTNQPVSLVWNTTITNASSWTIECSNGQSDSGTSVQEFTYTGSKQTLTLDAGMYYIELYGAEGGGGWNDGVIFEGWSGGKGGFISGNFTANQDDDLELWVGQQGQRPAGGWGRHYGGNGGYNPGGGGGGSTEVLLDDVFLAAADAGGGGASRSFSNTYCGGGGARGGSGGTGGDYSGGNAAGTGFGGDGGDPDQPGDDGGAEGNTTAGFIIDENITGGGNSGHGEIILRSYHSNASISLTGLDYDTNYTVWVNSTNGTVWTNETFNFRTTLGPPTNIQSSFNSTTQNLTITWAKSVSADYTLIRKSLTSYPASVTAGTEVGNVTGTSVVDESIDAAYYYTLWLYNETDGYYGEPGYLAWDALNLSALNVYDETTGVNVTEWDVIISSDDGSETYISTGNNNTFFLNVSNIPTGNDVSFTFSATGYQSRTYTLDVDDIINLDAYLPRFYDGDIRYKSVSISDPDSDAYVLLDCVPDSIIQVEGYNGSTYGHWFPIPDDKYSVTANNVTVNQSVLDSNTLVVRVTYLCDDDVLDYVIHVQDILNNPISKAKVTVQRVITGNYTTIMSMLTDGNGDTTLTLIPDVTYRLFITKTGYDDETAIFIPTLSVRTKTYILQVSIDPVNVTRWDNYISMSASIDDETCLINMSYSDTWGDTTNVTVIVERYDAGSYVLNYTGYGSGNSFTLSTAGNCSRSYRVTFTVIHGEFGTFNYSIDINRADLDIVDVDDLEAMFEEILGDHPFGWINFFSIFILLAGLFAFGEQGAGISLAGTGFMFLFLNILIVGIVVTTMIPILFIVLGLLVIWNDMRRLHA